MERRIALVGCRILLDKHKPLLRLKIQCSQLWFFGDIVVLIG